MIINGLVFLAIGLVHEAGITRLLELDSMDFGGAEPISGACEYVRDSGLVWRVEGTRDELSSDGEWPCALAPAVQMFAVRGVWVVMGVCMELDSCSDPVRIALRWKSRRTFPLNSRVTETTKVC